MAETQCIQVCGDDENDLRRFTTTTGLGITKCPELDSHRNLKFSQGLQCLDRDLNKSLRMQTHELFWSPISSCHARGDGSSLHMVVN